MPALSSIATQPIRLTLIALLLGSIGLQRLVPCDEAIPSCDGVDTTHVLEVIGSATHPCQSNNTPHEDSPNHACTCVCHITAIVNPSLATVVQPEMPTLTTPYRRTITDGTTFSVDHIPIS